MSSIVSDGPPTVTSSIDPSQSTSSPADNSTDTDTRPVFPGSPNSPPFFETTDDGVTYTNTTIDDFSPLVVFSGLDGEEGGDWVSPLTDSGMSAVRPVPQRQWYLGTYRRTEVRNANVTIEFWGSEIHLYGDRGPAYGAFALTLDNGTPTIHTAFSPERAEGTAHHLHSLQNLSEGKHELVITNLGTREGLNEGSSFLFDYAVVRQRVGVSGRPEPKSFDIYADAFEDRLERNGTWVLHTIADDIPPGPGGAKPEIYIERETLSTTEESATLTYTFRGTGVQLFGGRNATHGRYRATLSTVGDNSTVFHSRVYEAAAPCDFPEAEAENVRPACEWRGRVLKFAAADLDPGLEYELQVENVGGPGGRNRVFELDSIRVIGDQPRPGGGGGSGGGNGGGSGGSGDSSGGGGNGDDDGETGGAARLNGVDPLVNFMILLMIFMAFWRAMRR
ncbi:hypothetical protein CC2G_002018 [Coprinopsis cinerea AmutBmut pab1-1]|nr:hypothetical protein CC2G_002018 [Coprinopsis cinerea AmutBmut pab1-1]